MLRLRTVRLVAPLLVMSIALAACGGDDGTSAAEPDTAPSTVADGDGGVGVFDSAECAEALAAWSSATASAGAALTGGAEDLGSSLEDLQTFAAAAPEEIRDELTLVYAAYGEFLAALEESGYDPASGAVPSADQLAALQTASEALQDSDVLAASDSVAEWFTSNCSG